MPKARIQKRLYYKIGEACKALDIQPYVLRYWETEFPAISPGKSRSGQRVYSDKELAIIRRIKELLYDEGYTIAGAKKKLEGELAGGTLGRADDLAEAEEPAAPAPPAAPAAPAGPASPAAPTTLAEPAASARDRRAPPAPSVEPEPRQAALRLDTRGDERIERLRSGVRRALAEARDILTLLGPPADP